MAAKRIVIACCALSFLQTSFAGFERFWIFSKDADTQISETWETLSEEEQLALIKRYQNLKEIPAEKSVALQQRMDWFTQLPDSEKQKMRETWQKMSTQERRVLDSFRAVDVHCERAHLSVPSLSADEISIGSAGNPVTE